MSVLANARIRTVLAPLKTAAAAVSASASAAVTATAPSALAAVASVQEETADGSDAATTQALANSLKAKYNAAQLEIVELRTTAGVERTELADIKARYNVMVTEMADVRAKLNALTAAIDAL